MLARGHLSGPRVASRAGTAASAGRVWCGREPWLCPCGPALPASCAVPGWEPALQERLCGLFLFAAVCRLSVFRQTTLSHFEIMNLKWNLIFLYLLWILLLCLLKCDVLHCLFFLHFLVESALK